MALACFGLPHGLCKPGVGPAGGGQARLVLSGVPSPGATVGPAPTPSTRPTASPRAVPFPSNGRPSGCCWIFARRRPEGSLGSDVVGEGET